MRIHSRRCARLAALVLATACRPIWAQDAPAPPPAEAQPAAADDSASPPGEPSEDPEAAYTRAITERADKIVAALGIGDAAQATRVRDLLIEQYRGLRAIHDARDAKIAEATGTPGGDPTVVAAWVGVARAQASIKLLHLHRYFVARLAAELPADQVDKIKDGMTYGVVGITYNRYLELLPNLTDAQKREILASLIEAREYAMDAGSADEKHQIFNQYKGRINNYLSAAGYNLKQAEKELAEQQKSATQVDSD